ncbi:MAG: hypothetical protein K5657_03495 [Desulfovibrio sp.]|nr:hypothetical protein [Desulfovibrio sp.]
MKSKYILITYPLFKGSVTFYSIWREFYDRKRKDYYVVSNNFWKKTLTEQMTELDDICDINSNNYIIFVPATLIPAKIPPQLLNAIKRVSKPIKLILYLQDSIERMSFQKQIGSEEFIKTYFSQFDYIYTYDLFESNKYNLNYHQLPYYIPDDNHKVLFIGRAKGRMHLLTKLQNLFEKKGITYEFYVLEDRKINQEEYNNIIFTKYLNYSDVIEKIKAATCLLSLKSYKAHMTTVAFNEAILFNKKLLANCDFLECIPFYNKKYMKKFKFVEDIDINFIKFGNNDINYNYHGQFSIDNFIDKISQKSLQIPNTLKATSAISFSYHFSVLGWAPSYSNNDICFFKNKRLESLKVDSKSTSVIINYGVYQKDNGWIECNSHSNQEAGVTGKSLPIYMVKFSLEPNPVCFEILYRVYIHSYGWTRFYRNGEICGETENTEKREISGIHCIINSYE